MDVRIYNNERFFVTRNISNSKQYKLEIFLNRWEWLIALLMDYLGSPECFPLKHSHKTVHGTYTEPNEVAHARLEALSNPKRAATNPPKIPKDACCEIQHQLSWHCVSMEKRESSTQLLIKTHEHYIYRKNSSLFEELCFASIWVSWRRR